MKTRRRNLGDPFPSSILKDHFARLQQDLESLKIFKYRFLNTAGPELLSDPVDNGRKPDYDCVINQCS